MNHIIPVATRYQSALLHNVEDMAAIFPVDKADKLSARNIKLIEEIAERTTAIEKGVEDLVEARKKANKTTVSTSRLDSEHQKAIAYHDNVEPKLDEIRYQIDKLELIVDDALWPLPKYRELLFIR
jgi:glutamine synthetase